LAVLEARAAKKLSSTQILFLPFIFCAFGLILGKQLKKAPGKYF